MTDKTIANEVTEAPKSRKLDKQTAPQEGRTSTYDERVDWVALSYTLKDVTDQHTMQMEKENSPQVLLDQVEDARKAQIEQMKQFDKEADEAKKNSNI